jgi:uncharacterized RmlC-like cupin family protein
MFDSSTHWGQDGVRLFSQDKLDDELVQSLSAQRIATLTHLPTGIPDVSGGVLEIPAGSSGVSHDAAPDEFLYMVTRGRICLRWGQQLEYSGTAGPGEGIRVPPWVRHAESNGSDSEILERLRMVTGR